MFSFEYYIYYISPNNITALMPSNIIIELSIPSMKLPEN